MSIAKTVAGIFVCLFIFGCTAPVHKSDTRKNGKDLLKRPGVRLVALTIIGNNDDINEAAALRWKALDREFRPLGLRIAVIALPESGICKKNPPFVVDNLICDTRAAATIAKSMGKAGQSFLWNHEQEQMVRLGTVQDVETAIRKYFAEMPRLVVADPHIKALPKQAKNFSRTRLYDLLAHRMGAGIKEALTLTDQNERRTLLQAVDGKPAEHPPVCDGAALPEKGVVYVTVHKQNGAVRLGLKWVDTQTGCLAAKGESVIGSGALAIETAVDEAMYPLREKAQRSGVQQALGLAGGSGDVLGVLSGGGGLEIGSLGDLKNPAEKSGTPKPVKPKDTPATQRYQARCDDGSVDDCVDLGWVLRTGEGVQVDFVRAKKALMRACGLGAALGCNDLGLMFELGEGMKADLKKAVYYYQQSCTMGNSHGCRNLGLMNENGRGTVANMEKAMDLFRKSCDMGNGLACNDVGHLLEHGKGSVAVDLSGAETFYQKSCKLKSGHGCTNVGFMYEKGIIGTVDLNAAVEHYRYGCDYGNATGCRNLGLLFVNGKGVTQNSVQANTLFSQACDLKDASGCRSLATSCEKGRGMTVDMVRAFDLYRLSCDLGSHDGCVDAGYFYEKGLGTRIQYQKAMDLYLKACDMGNRHGCGNVGILYGLGRGCKKDNQKAIRFYRKGCDMGNGSSCRSLGLKYEKGTDVTPNVNTALELYQKGCGFSEKAACNDVGYLYEYGTGGLKKDITAACDYYKKACDLKDENGCVNLKRTCTLK